jgi:glucose/arabinose dehydrogenase
MKRHLMAALLAGAAIAVAAPAFAETNLDLMRGVRTTGTSFAAQFIDQTGPKAEHIKKHLEAIKLPAGFKIGLYAIVPDARHMAVGPQGTVLWVGTRKVDVYTVVDRDKDRIADEVEPYAPPLDFKVPNGLCISRDGILFLVEHNRVLKFPAAEFFWENPDVAVDVVVPQGDLVPPDEESYNHGARVCQIGPDNKLYIALGQRYNVPPPEKLDLYHRLGLGGIIRMNQDGTGREVYAYGVRNSVGLDFNPANGELWFTDNQVDGMGDDIPPGELNRATAAGLNFGFPWYGGGHVRTNEYKDEEPPADVVFPEVEMAAHAADLGMTFYTGTMFPAKYRGGIFSAQHGSWNRTTPVGARVMFTSLNEDGGAAETTVFASGWLNEQTGEYLGRPVDVKQLADGSLLVSDDFAGAVYRIWYEGN